MGLLDNIEDEIRAPGGICHVSLLREDLTGADLEQFDRVLANRRINSTAISRSLRTSGVELSPRSLQRHRNGDCLCRRP